MGYAVGEIEDEYDVQAEVLGGVNEEAGLGVVDFLPVGRAVGALENVGTSLDGGAWQYYGVVALVAEREGELHLTWDSGLHLNAFQGELGEQYGQAIGTQLDSSVSIERYVARDLACTLRGVTTPPEFKNQPFDEVPPVMPPPKAKSPRSFSVGKFTLTKVPPPVPGAGSPASASRVIT